MSATYGENFGKLVVLKLIDGAVIGTNALIKKRQQSRSKVCNSRGFDQFGKP